jgi:RNA polymerase sigma-70 factor, ECF subfamily
MKNSTTPPLNAAVLYDQYMERIYRYHLARTGSVPDAEDLTAETFRAAIEGIDRCRPEQAAAWLVGIARHKLADHQRRCVRFIPLEALEERPYPSPAVEDLAGQRLEMARVSHALRLLNADRAEAIALHYFAGLSLSEVGRVMGKSEEAVKKLVQRGLAEMRDRLVVTTRRRLQNEPGN